jgi:hypothetical protein
MIGVKQNAEHGDVRMIRHPTDFPIQSPGGGFIGSNQDLAAVTFMALGSRSQSQADAVDTQIDHIGIDDPVFAGEFDLCPRQGSVGDITGIAAAFVGRLEGIKLAQRNPECQQILGNHQSGVLQKRCGKLAQACHCGWIRDQSGTELFMWRIRSMHLHE